MYIEFEFIFKNPNPWLEIMMAHLGETEFDSFEDTDNILKAYILEKNYDPQIVEDILKQFSYNDFYFTTRKIENQNWNLQWENEYSKVIINQDCEIRADFHPKNNNCKYDIIINPKMSFGTAHHPTTFLMVESILQMDLNQKTVLDMGSGTGILGILADKKSANKTYCIDIEDNAYTNCEENIKLNNCKNIENILGDSNILDTIDNCDVIFANINRNILIEDKNIYCKKLNNNGILLLSGFYHSDNKLIIEKYQENGLSLKQNRTKDDWSILIFEKIESKF